MLALFLNLQEVKQDATFATSFVLATLKTLARLIMNVVEWPSGGFSAGGGISSGITSGPLSGLIGSFAYSHRNVFRRNQKLNISLERGQTDSLFRVNYIGPWIEGDDKRTSRTIMVQNSRTPGTPVHGNQTDNSSLTIGRVTAGIEFSRPIRPKWSGTAGLIFRYFSRTVLFFTSCLTFGT